MATEPKKTRKSGPRVAKDKVVYLLFKGEIDVSSIRVETSADAVMDAMDNDSSLKRARVVLKAKKKADAPTAA
jgi:hypothetical protein